MTRPALLRHGRFVTPPGLKPGVLFVHGWDSDQTHYQDLSDEVAALGCVCLTFDLRGHGNDAQSHREVSREDNLQDVLAAYDTLVKAAMVDRNSIVLIGTSYGGYLATIASRLRSVRWLALRVPALYPDAQWDVPKARLDRAAVARYRSNVVEPSANRALAACRAFTGEALVVESELDAVVPHPSICSFVEALAHAGSVTYHCIQGADHALSSSQSRIAYELLLSAWMIEKVVGRRAPVASGG